MISVYLLLDLNLWAFRSVRFSDTKQRKAVAAANDVPLVCVKSVRQPSTICAKSGIPASFHLSRPPFAPCSFRHAVS